MKHCKIKTIISCLAASVILFCVTAFSSVAFAETNVSNEAELRTALSAGEEIVMTGDIKLASCLKIESGNVTLDLNGYKLYRELESAKGDGSVIEVSKDGSLTIKDSSNDTGTITGGFAANGGGILNYGTLDVQGGKIVGNQASNNGGGINAAAGSKTTIANATVMKNDAKNGGGINIEVGAQPVEMTNTTVRNNTALYNGGGIQDLGGVALDGCTIVSNNAYDLGSGVYVNYNTISVKGTNVIKKNTGSNVYLRNNKTITVIGKLDAKSEIGVSGDSANITVTSGYSDYHSEEPSNYFFSDLDGGSVTFSSDKKEVNTLAGYSVVEVYDGNNTVTKSELCSAPDDAWNKAVSYAGNTGKVVCKLGSNWSHDRQLSVSGNKKLTLDLNGFYILRTRDGEETENGNIFTIEKGASFTIIDSRPKSKGYDGFKGGVITGGCNDDDGGGIIVGKDASLFIEGGTLYNCYADGDGGGIYISENADKVDIRNCRIANCTADSFKADGGAIYDCINDFTMMDSKVTGCYSNDNGGGVCIDSDGSGSGNLYFKNVIFSNNIAEDYAGGLCIWDFDNEGDYLLFDGCDFFSNSSNTTDGGGVYIDGNSKVFTLFKNCNFMYNESGHEGGGMAVYDDNVALASCLFAQNKAVNDGGGIVVNGKNDINVKGLMIIKDNELEKNGDNKSKNLCLEIEVLGTARLYSGGLYEGSYISVGHAYEFARNIPEYQQKYYYRDDGGKIEFKKTGTVDTPLITSESSETASIFGRGSVIVIASVTAATLAAGLAAVSMKKKKGDAEYDSDDE